MHTYGKTYQGIFTPTHPEKYVGDATKIVWRSSWERKAMVYFDTSPAVIAWSSEEIAIAYFNPIKKRAARYFPDFMVKFKTKTGVKTFIVEVKPAAKSKEPKKRGGKITRSFVAETIEWSINKAKWEAAVKHCERYGMEFKVLNEKDLNITF
jgi:hypothetical protein